MGEEHLVFQKHFGSKVQMKRELSVDIREAFRQRDAQCKSLATKHFCNTEYVRMCCHTIINIGDITFYELADIDMLRYPEMAK